jgi:hypothetical protein
MGTTELRQVQDELEAILLADTDRSFWSTATRGLYWELIRRETFMLLGRRLAIV